MKKNCTKALSALPFLLVLLLSVWICAGCAVTEKPAGAAPDGAVSNKAASTGAAPLEAASKETDTDPAGGAGTKGTEDSRLQVVTTIFPQYDFARQIAGDSADVSMLLKPGEEVHSYEPTPLDIKRIQNSDLFIYTGGENDVWVESILESVGENGPRTVRMLDLVNTVAEEELEGKMPEKGEHDHVHAEAAGHDPEADGDGHTHEEEGYQEHP